MSKSKDWPLRRVVEEFRTQAGEWKERLECGHVVDKNSKYFSYYKAERRRCRACADQMNRGGT
jgi:hypothetical protein